MSTPLVDAIIAETPAAELLRSVAARMCTLAEAATTGTWAHVCAGSHGCQVYNDGRLREHKSVAFFGRKEWKADHADADYVAGMQPAVALAVAAWLEDIAAELDEVPGMAFPVCTTDKAMAVARAFMDSTGWRP